MQVAYNDVGTGHPIVFIPGLVGTKDWFAYQSSGLCKSYRIISYDLRPVRWPSKYTVDLLAEDVANLLAALKLHSAAIVGHSFGAMIAQKVALSHRHCVDSLVLISAFPCLPDGSQDSLIKCLAPGEVRTQSAMAAIMRRLFCRKNNPSQDDKEGIDWLAKNSMSLSSATLNKRIKLVQQFDSCAWLSDIESPTLVMVGAQDKAPFLSSAQVFYEKIPNSELEVIEDGDHFCFYTRHDIVNGLIDDFLRKHPVGS